MLMLSKTPEYYEMRFTNVELNSCLFFSSLEKPEAL